MDMEIFFPGGQRVEAIYKGFIIKTDQPKNVGGDGSAPEPFSLFLGSIGTCAGIYVLSFCQNRNLSTDDLKVFLTFEKNNKTKLIKKINIEIKVPKDFPDSYKNAIIKTAGLCMVKKHIDNPPNFEISVIKDKN